MSKILDDAFARASALPEDEQERLGLWLMEELLSDERWDELFASSQDKLSRLAREARENYRSGNTEPLEPDRL